MADHSATGDLAVPARKQQLRDQLLAARRDLPVAELGERARALAELLGTTPELRRAATVAAYVSVGSEPGTGPLLAALRESGRRVLLPVVRPDLDLDWAAYDGDAGLAPGRMRLLEPTGARLGLDAVAGADLVLVPGLAAGRDGTRLGRGAGCYDRVLARVPVGTPTWLVVHPEELLGTVPVQPHDRRVGGVATAEGLLRLRPPGLAAPH